MTFQNLKTATDYLAQKRQIQGIDLSLERIQQACAQLGHPEHGQALIHFAGSNGKGSTLHYSQEILLAQGFTVASFTSPANETILDQICYNREPITANLFITLLNQICTQLGEDNLLTEFELLTLLAFLFFQKKSPDFVLLETGMGGRLDATNVAEGIAAVITTISLEHTQFLGETLEAIATEKAGIIRENKPVFIGNVLPEVRQVIEQQAGKMKAVCYFFNDEFTIELQETPKLGECFSFQATPQLHNWNHLQIAMTGRHQVENAALAIRLCIWLGVGEAAIRKGLLISRWQGRFEILSQSPLILLDGAHNPAGIQVLTETIERKLPNKKWHILFSAFQDKNHSEMLRPLEAIAKQMIFTEIPHERTMKAVNLFTISTCPNKQIISNHQQAIATMKNTLQEDEALLITGTLEWLRIIQKNVERK